MNKFRVLTEDRSLQSKMCLIRPFSFIHSLNSLDEKNIPVGQTQIILHTRLPTFSKDHWRLFWKNNYSEQFVFIQRLFTDIGHPQDPDYLSFLSFLILAPTMTDTGLEG
mgnify:CR=1 FL=1